MPRLQSELLARVEQFCDRTLDVVDAIRAGAAPARVLDQMAAAATSVGANLFEASEAMSRADFCKCVGIALKELNETRFWLRLVGRRGWVKPERLLGLEAECLELQKILGAMVARTKGVESPPRNLDSIPSEI